MDACVGDRYTVVYFHDPMLTKHADFWGLRKWGNILPKKYYENLHRVIVVGPPAFFKAEVALLYPFFSKVLWSNMVYVRGLEDLAKYMDIKQLKVPDEVMSAALAKIQERGAKEAESSDTVTPTTVPDTQANARSETDAAGGEA